MNAQESSHCRSWLLFALVAGCTGDVGTIQVALVSAAGSDALAGASVARLSLSEPFTEVTGTIDEDGHVNLSIDLPATPGEGFLTFVAEDDAGTVLASGRTPPLPLAGIDFEARIFVAPPRTIGIAPTSLGTRANSGAGALSIGAVFFAGTSTSGPVATTTIYDVYRHAARDARTLPMAARRAQAAGLSGDRALVVAQSSNGDLMAWRFDAGIPPAGGYADVEISPQVSWSEHASLVPFGDERVVWTSTPVAVFDSRTLELAPLSAAAGYNGVAVSLTGGAPRFLLVGTQAGPTGAVLVTENTAEELDGPQSLARERHTAVSIPEGALILGGVDSRGQIIESAVRFDAATEVLEELPAFLAEPRANCTAVVVGEHLIVAGGRGMSGEVLTSVEIFDAITLEPRYVTSMQTPRERPHLVELANEQLLIAGGSGGELELFSP